MSVKCLDGLPDPRAPLSEVFPLTEIAERINKYRQYKTKVKEKSVDRTSMTTPNVLPLASVPANTVQWQQ